MSPSSAQLDLTELVASLVRELGAGVRAAEQGALGHLVVTEATVRVGQLGRTEDDQAEEGHAAGAAEGPVSGAPGVRDAPPPRSDARRTGGLRSVALSPVALQRTALARPALSPLVTQEGLESRAWEMEVRLTDGVEVLQGGPSRAAPGTDEPGGEPGGPDASSLWRDRPTNTIKGIDTARGRALSSVGIHTVGAMLDLGPPEVSRLVERLGFPVLDHWVAAQLLRAPMPRLAASPADPMRLRDLVGRAPQRLRELIGPDVCSASAAEQLFASLAGWGAAIDRDELGRVTFGQLRAALR